MKTLPLRWRFAFWSVVLGATLVVLFAFASFLHVYREQIEAVDLEIRGEAKHLLELHRQGLLAADADTVLAAQPWLAFAHFSSTGEMVSRTVRLSEDLARATLSAPAPRTVRTAETDWRLGAETRGGETFVVGYDLEEVHDVMGELLLVYLGLLPLVLAAAGYGGWLIAGRVLDPVRRLTAAAESIEATDLGHRVPVPPAADELQRLARVFNAMLDRLESGFAQARRFSADASHELRTPLTILQGEIERLLHAREWPPENEATLLSIQEEISRLDRITEHLLLLASFDSGRARMRFDTVDFAALVRDACEDAGILGEALEVALDTDIPAAVTVAGDSHHLRRLLLNLLQNAIRHNHAAGQVRCVVTVDPAHVVLRVSNTGPGIPAEARERLFERFFRSDPSRTQREGHGLGLALCREIVRAHHGEITLNTAAPPGWVEFVVSLPR